MHSNTNILRVDPLNPEPELIQKAGKILTNFGVVIFPAKCLYGVAAHALNPEAVEKVFQLKQRPANNPLLVLIKNQSMLHELVTEIPETAQKLMDTFWPGNLTLIFNARSHVPEQLTAGTGKIGIRIPVHPVAKALVNVVDFPVTGTSANLSGKPGCADPDQLDSTIINDADLLLDAGLVKGGTGSTIADTSRQVVEIHRQGEISESQIKTALK